MAQAGAWRAAADAATSLAVTSPVAWSPDGSQFVYGLYDGTVAVAKTPASGRPAVQASFAATKP